MLFYPFFDSISQYQIKLFHLSPWTSFTQSPLGLSHSFYKYFQYCIIFQIEFSRDALCYILTLCEIVKLQRRVGKCRKTERKIPT